MSGFEIAALAVAAVWLGALTFLVLLLVRQVGMVTAWARRSASAQTVGEDGIDVGAAVPQEAITVASELQGQHGYVLFLAGDCQPCREFASDTARSEEFAALRDQSLLVASVRGKGAQADEVARMLPSWVQVIQEPVASHLATAFEVETTPMVYEVEDGKVIGRVVAGYGLPDFLRLVAARDAQLREAAAKVHPQPAAEVINVMEVDNGRV